MADMAAIAMGHLDGVIQREKQLYIHVHDRPKKTGLTLSGAKSWLVRRMELLIGLQFYFARVTDWLNLNVHARSTSMEMGLNENLQWRYPLPLLVVPKADRMPKLRTSLALISTSGPQSRSVSATLNFVFVSGLWFFDSLTDRLTD